MAFLVALPILLSSFAGPSLAAQPASVPPFPLPTGTVADSPDNRPCRSGFVTAQATERDQAVMRTDGIDPPAILISPVDMRLDGCEMIVPVGGPLQPLPRAPEADAKDLFHRTDDQP